MPKNAVCIRCGHFKVRALAKCPHCQFQPHSELEEAESLVLSKAFDVGEKSIGRSAGELEAISKTIQAGTPFSFDSAELEMVMNEHRLAKTITPRRLIRDGVKWLGPPIVLLAAMLWLVWRRT